MAYQLLEDGFGVALMPLPEGANVSESAVLLQDATHFLATRFSHRNLAIGWFAAGDTSPVAAEVFAQRPEVPALVQADPASAVSEQVLSWFRNHLACRAMRTAA